MANLDRGTLQRTHQSKWYISKRCLRTEWVLLSVFALLVVLSCGGTTSPGSTDATALEDENSAPVCDAQDALGDDACRALVGYKWNGDFCEALWGCECVGADCDDIFETEEDCLSVYDGCEDVAFNCDSADVACRASAPDCPQGEVPSVVNQCWGECVPLKSCSCEPDGPETQCPGDDATCWNFKRHCGPYVR